MCVMGGALLVALPTFQWALRHVRTGAHPLANVCYELPSKTAVDSNLVVGALLFGAGWGEQAGGFALGCGNVNQARGWLEQEQHTARWSPLHPW